MNPRDVVKEFLNALPRLPFSQSELAYLERILALKQGKGWGAATIAQEIDCCLTVLLDAPAVIVDIGANQGDYSQELLSRFPQAEFYLFEPSRYNCQRLAERFAGCPGIAIRCLAVSSCSGRATLYSDRQGSGLASLTRRNLAHFGLSMDQEESVDVIRFDDFWSSVRPFGGLIDYVKIDIEGHELDALTGMGDLIHDTKIIQFEFGGCNIDTRTYFQDFWYFFSARGFRLYRITPSGPALLSEYREADEFFATTNYIAVNNRLLPHAG